jgi:hypothetical protein
MAQLAAFRPPRFLGWLAAYRGANRSGLGAGVTGAQTIDLIPLAPAYCSSS